MKIAIYYPKRDRIDFISKEGLSSGIMGTSAHLKAVRLMMSKTTIVIISLDK